MKLEQGDRFEKENANWIREKLPNYENIWAAFVGHLGNGQPCEMPDLPENKNENRKLFYQAHYSFAISAFQLGRISKLIQKEISPIKSLEQFLYEYERLFLFMAYIGHVRDMFLQMDAAIAFGKGSLSGEFQGFYDQRSHVLHGTRMPAFFDDVSWSIPIIAKRNEAIGEWHKKATWDSIDSKKAITVPDFIAETYNDAFQLITLVHSKVFEAADNYFEGRRIIERNSKPQDASLEISLDSKSTNMTDLSTSPVSGVYSGVLNLPPK